MIVGLSYSPPCAEFRTRGVEQSFISAKKEETLASTRKYKPTPYKIKGTILSMQIYYSAFLQMGRTYDIAAEMLKDLGVSRIRLMTNNPLKINGLIENGINVEQRLEHVAGISNFNSQYLATKGTKNGPPFGLRLD